MIYQSDKSLLCSSRLVSIPLAVLGSRLISCPACRQALFRETNERETVCKQSTVRRYQQTDLSDIYCSGHSAQFSQMALFDRDNKLYRFFLNKFQEKRSLVWGLNANTSRLLSCHLRVNICLEMKEKVIVHNFGLSWLLLQNTDSLKECNFAILSGQEYSDRICCRATSFPGHFPFFKGCKFQNEKTRTAYCLPFHIPD